MGYLHQASLITKEYYNLLRILGLNVFLVMGDKAGSKQLSCIWQVDISALPALAVEARPALRGVTFKEV